MGNGVLSSYAAHGVNDLRDSDRLLAKALTPYSISMSAKCAGDGDGIDTHW